MSNVKFLISNFKKGFTLIELLVVIAIMSILASVLYGNFVSVRQRARDAQRKADLRRIQSDIEVYRSDKGYYPLESALSSCGGSFVEGSTMYIRKIPCDPLPDPVSSNRYVYAPTTGCDNTATLCTTYSIYACLENRNDPDIDVDGVSAKINCSGSTTRWKFTVLSP